MLFKGKSSKLELLIEKIQSTREDPLEEVSEAACSSLWDGGSEEGRGSLTGTPTSSEEGRENITGTPNSTSGIDVDASSTVGVTDTTPYQCTFCDLAFPRLSYLKKHEQSHADQLPFKCDFCGRHFKHKRSRDRHVKLHTGDKKYKCSQCEAAFSRSDHLKIHMKTHDTQKPYRCTICTRGYSTTAALTAHMQNHKSKAPSTSLDHLLKDASRVGIGACDPALISRLIQDSKEKSSEKTNESEKEENHSCEGASDEVDPLAIDLISTSVIPSSAFTCPLCHVSCKSHAHLQIHITRHNSEERNMHSIEERSPSNNNTVGGNYSQGPRSEAPVERPSSIISSGNSSAGGILKAEASPTASSPSSRPASVVTSPRPHNLSSNPFLSLIGSKLVCPFCNCDGFLSFETFQLHIQSIHGSTINNEILGLSSLSSFRPSGFFSPLVSPLGTAGSSRQVTCELCGARVSGVAALQRHVITAHSFTDLLARAAEGVFCAQCLLPFSNPGALTEHIKLVHTAPTPSIVPTLSLLSGALSKRPSSPLRDKPTDLSKKPRRENPIRDIRDLPSSTLLCSQCDAPFADFESFRSHLKTHLEGHETTSTFVCPECQAHISTELAIESHLASHFESVITEYGCHACMKTFSKPDELQKHLLDMHAHHLYRCTLCRQVFDSKVSIQVHFAVNHSNENKLYKCLKCSIKFSSQTEFDSHLREAHVQRSDRLRTLNGLTLPSNELSALSPKSKLNSGPGVIGGFRCLLCPVALSSEVEMTAHLATHERQFKCALCEEAFHVEFLLDRHVQSSHANELNGSHSESPHKQAINDSTIHLNSMDLRCGICDTHFTSDATLSLHRKQAHNIKCPSNKVATATLSLFCAYCSEVCKSRSDLEAHMKTTHVGASSGRHKCNICDELFPSASTLAQHKLSHVKVLSGSAYCVVCRGQLLSPEQVKAHQRDHYQKPLPQPCVVCRQTLVADIEVKVHARFHALSTASIDSVFEPLPSVSNDVSSNHELISSSKCSDCQLKFESSEESQNHLCHHRADSKNSNNGLREKLRFIEKEDSNCDPEREKMENVSINGGGSRTYQCIKCQESFDSESAIEAHVTSHLEQEGSTHFCHLCRSYFDTPLRLQCHLIEHTFEGCGSFTCYICGSVFTAAARLQHHMVTHGLSAKPYDCHHCRQSFFFRSELENHLPTHTECANGCQDCQGAFSKGLHTRHTMLENFGISCHLCSFVAKSLVELQSHSHYHKSSRSESVSSAPTPCSLNPLPSPIDNDSSPQVCKTCSRKCRNGLSLHLHNLTHEGGKPYLCGECGAAFTRRCEAARHPSVHHRDQLTRKCTICRRELSSSVEAQEHVKSTHGGQDYEVVRPDSRCSSCEDDLDSSDSSQTLP